MKKLFATIMILMLVFLCCTASASGNSNSCFIPELLTMSYNEAISPVFTALSLDASTVSSIEAYAKVSYFKKEDSTIVYANDAQTIFFFFAAPDRYTEAENLMFYTSLKDENPVKNLPQHAFSFAVCTLDSSCDFSSFGLWVNEAKHGSTYSATSFDAVYQLTPSDNSSIILIK